MFGGVNDVCGMFVGCVEGCSEVCLWDICRYVCGMFVGCVEGCSDVCLWMFVGGVSDVLRCVCGMFAGCLWDVSASLWDV